MKFMNMLRQPYLDEFDASGGTPSPEPEPTPEPTPAPEPEPTPEGPAIKVKYNHEEIELPYAEAIQHIQKGMNYDKAVERAKNDSIAEIERISGEATQKDQLAMMLFETAFKGEINPYTQKPIETIEDFIAWKEEDDKKQLEKAGLSPDYLKQMIANDPTVQQAAAILQHNQQIQQKFAVDAEVAEIQKINPKIKSIADLLDERKEDETFNALVKGGMSLSKAYATVNKVPQRKPDDTKNHLQSIGGGNAGSATEPPSDVVKEYQKWNPKATMDEIRSHWAKSHGGNKK